MLIYTRTLFSLFAVTLFFIGGFSLPVAAQTATTTTDGSNDSPTERRQYIRGWRGQSNEMSQKVQALGTTISTTVTIPVLFGVELTNLRSDFGDARSNGRTHIGNDIMAPKGTPIVSPTAAVVLRTGVGSGEGNYVYTANPGGETFVYMHLDAFGEGVVQGTVLEKGSLIGYVGNTGNASGGAAHLHFEIHTDGTAIDPYTRINGTFTITEKMQYLTAIFATHKDPSVLAQVLVNNFRPQFIQATSLGIAFPEIIKTYMSTLPVTTPTSSPGSTALPAGDLALGSKGSAVVTLQQFLIVKNTGPFAVRLSQAGATGNFGAMTEAALIEYQTSVGISPANGYYGPTTRTKVEANVTGTTAVPALPAPTVPAGTASTLLSRDLSLNVVGEDVQVLQKFLNSKGYTVAVSGAGSVGYETTFFGNATQAAVIKFQTANGITPAAGYVGPITRKVLISMGI